MFSNLSKKDRSKLLKLILVLIVGVAYFACSLYEQSKNRSKLSDDESVFADSAYHTMHYIDASQGDCTLLETSGGKFAIIDTSTDIAREKILAYLEDVGVQEIEYLVLTHPHEDHIGNADDILKNFRVNNVVMTDKTENTSAYKRLIEQLQNSKNKYGTSVIKPDNGDVFTLDGVTFKVISDGKAYEELNNSSICLTVEYGKSTFLFTGDAEKTVEDDLLNSAVFLDAEVYKCGHHGSSTSNSEEFLDEINPEICIISCGMDNDYGHPHDEVLEALYERNIPYYITYRDGDIKIRFDKENILSPDSTLLLDAE